MFLNCVSKIICLSKLSVFLNYRCTHCPPLPRIIETTRCYFLKILADTDYRDSFRSVLYIHTYTQTYIYTGCGRNNSHILKGNKNQMKQGTKKSLFLQKAHMMPFFFSNTFKDNIAQVAAVIDDTLLKPFTEVVHGFAGHYGRNGCDFLSYCLL